MLGPAKGCAMNESARWRMKQWRTTDSAYAQTWTWALEVDDGMFDFGAESRMKDGRDSREAGTVESQKMSQRFVFNASVDLCLYSYRREKSTNKSSSRSRR